ncbi:MAG: SDR family oxidoreductase, partial [Terracidiphilus sp.]
MKIVITGANGAVGRAILKREQMDAAPRVTIVAAVRSRRAAEDIRTQLGHSDEIVSISYDDPQSLDSALLGDAALIHLAGILVERSDSTYEHANVESTRSVVESAKQAAVQKLVLVSAIGADEDSSNRYYRTKGEAETLVRTSGLCYTVLRVPRLLGCGTAGAKALQRSVSTGRARLIGGGRHLEQPLDVRDVAKAAVQIATRPSLASNVTLDLVGPDS